MKTIILCADDYGQNSAISQAILDLFEKKRLSATSCMTNFPHWKDHAQGLLHYKNDYQIGLHLNLTEGPPLTSNLGAHFPGISNWIIKAYTKKLDFKLIAAEFNAQLDAFVEAMGKMPDFIDGHQHIHLFPGIRDVFIQIYLKRLLSSRAYVRSVAIPHAFWGFWRPAYVKTLGIQWLGAQTFKKLLEKNEIPHNSTFSGFYYFKERVIYNFCFPFFLNEVKEGGIIMCHPAKDPINQEVESDLIMKARKREYDYFSSAAFLKACERAKAKLLKLETRS